MLVRFTKGPVAAKADTITCVREDGSTTTTEMPRQGILPHDAFHFVVERTLDWRDGFFGAVARGLPIDGIQAKERKPQVAWSAQALRAESLVECLQAEQWGGAVEETTFRENLATGCRVRGVSPPVLTADDLRRVRTALREFGATWRPLQPGQSLERDF